jgi:UbiD family decarboxylase
VHPIHFGKINRRSVRDSPLTILPIPRFFDREARHYITAGVILARDSFTGSSSASFARFATHDGHTAMVGITF